MKPFYGASLSTYVNKQHNTTKTKDFKSVYNPNIKVYTYTRSAYYSYYVTPKVTEDIITIKEYSNSQISLQTYLNRINKDKLNTFDNLYQTFIHRFTNSSICTSSKLDAYVAYFLDYPEEADKHKQLYAQALDTYPELFI